MINFVTLPFVSTDPDAPIRYVCQECEHTVLNPENHRLYVHGAGAMSVFNSQGCYDDYLKATNS